MLERPENGADNHSNQGSKKAQKLIDFLKSLDFIESITEKELTGAGESDVVNQQEQFFAMAGLWAGRDISLKTIREQAWPYRT